MGAVADKSTSQIPLELFRAKYADCKPYYELLNGEAVQKAIPTDLHSTLQGVLYTVLKELGFKARTELTLPISDIWEPVPDVCGLLAPLGGEPYPISPVPVVIEILSPGDPFARVVQKCRRYSQWGVADILVFDPIGREAWHWDATTDDLMSIRQSYAFKSKDVDISLFDVFRRLAAELQ
jgi:Uma2 family endonuclease